MTGPQLKCLEAVADGKVTVTAFGLRKLPAGVSAGSFASIERRDWVRTDYGEKPRAAYPIVLTQAGQRALDRERKQVTA